MLKDVCAGPHRHQQLTDTPVPMHSFRPFPYSMCFREECEERQRHSQISEFEATFETHSEPLLTQRTLDPCLAVTKYRRSAAGDTRNGRPTRTLLQLETAWTHLSQVFVHQTAHYRLHRNQSIPRSSLLSTVSFVDDRIRALQVDLVVSQQTSPVLQLQMARYHIVCVYLLCQEVPGKKRYEPKFAQQALWTALSAYWNTSSPNEAAAKTSSSFSHERTRQHDDEVLCYTALLHVASCLQQEQQQQKSSSTNPEASQGYGQVLALAWKRRQRRRQSPSLVKKHESRAGGVDPSLYPRFQWALQLTAAAQMGLYRVVLSMLSNHNPETTSIESSKQHAVLCRCCMATALNSLRMGAVSHYNKAFGKREAIAGEEMARLLYLPTAASAVNFCRHLGLPVDDNDRILMKAAPIHEHEEKVLQNSRNRKLDDVFVFGEAAWAQWIRSDGNDTLLPRVDQEGVSIPPPDFLTSLIVFDTTQAQYCSDFSSDFCSLAFNDGNEME